MVASKRKTDSPTAMPRKRADGQETIQRVLKAAEEEMEASGFIKFNMDRVVAATGVSRSSIHHHFGDRDGLIAAVETEYLLRRFDAGMSDLARALHEARSGEEAFALVELGIGLSSSDRQRAMRWRRISTLAAARASDAIKASLQETQVRGTRELAAMLDELRARGMCDPTIPSLGIASLIQSMLIGRILVDIVEDDEMNSAWDTAVVESLRLMLRPTPTGKSQ